jgi:hypothetical protein
VWHAIDFKIIRLARIRFEYEAPALVKGLAARGHPVYAVGHLPQKRPIPNYTDFSVEGTLPAVLTISRFRLL